MNRHLGDELRERLERAIEADVGGENITWDCGPVMTPGGMHYLVFLAIPSGLDLGETIASQAMVPAPQIITWTEEDVKAWTTATLEALRTQRSKMIAESVPTGLVRP